MPKKFTEVRFSIERIDMDITFFAGKEFVAFAVCFLIFVYSVFDKKWGAVNLSTIGMVASALAMAYRFFGGL